MLLSASCCSRVWPGLREQMEPYTAVLTKDGAAPSVLSALLYTWRRGGTNSRGVWAELRVEPKILPVSQQTLQPLFPQIQLSPASQAGPHAPKWN